MTATMNGANKIYTMQVCMTSRALTEQQQARDPAIQESMLAPYTACVCVWFTGTLLTSKAISRNIQDPNNRRVG